MAMSLVCMIDPGGHDMDTEPERATQYLERALELRKKARSTLDRKAKQMLLNEADDFERMAAEITKEIAQKKSRSGT